ncbi:MAG: H-type lectin domain-containing protein [Gammaproteobacteria bacterium]|nr:H-type lectin domain-containing protein [Gammaproteobacteria bacterium]
MRFRNLAIACVLSAMYSGFAQSATIRVSVNCSISAALQSANTDTAVTGCTAGSGLDTIILEQNQDYVLTNITFNRQPDPNSPFTQSGPYLLAISSDTNIVGNGATLRSNNTQFNSNDVAMVFIHTGANVEISNLTLQGGQAITQTRANQSIVRSGLVKGTSITNLGLLTLRNVRITGAQTHLGFIPGSPIAEPAAIANYGRLFLRTSNITSNQANGIYTNDGATTTISLSTITSNTFAAGIQNRGITEIGNSLIAANMGGQIHAENGTVTLHNDTVIGTSVVENNANLVVANTVLSNGSNQACHFINTSSETSLTQQGPNWFEDSSCNGIAQGDPRITPVNITGANPSITLQDNSPLIDAGDNSICAAGLVTNTDLLLTGRPQGRLCDIGAIEQIQQTNVNSIVFLQTNVINHQFQQIYENAHTVIPLIGFSPPTFQGAQPGIVRLRTSSAGFTGLSFLNVDARLQEFTYLDQFHIIEQISLIGFYPGVSIEADGTRLAADQFVISGNNIWQTVNFQQPFQTPPHVFLFAQTSNGGQPPIIRVRNVTTTGFEVAINEEERLVPSGHIAETLAFLAVENPAQQGTIMIDGQPVSFSLAKVQVNHNWISVLGRQIRLQEEQSLDAETQHVNETVVVMRLGDAIFAQAVTNNGADPFVIRTR